MRCLSQATILRRSKSQRASFAISGQAATPWYSDWYATSDFGHLQAGTGLITRELLVLALIALPGTLFGAWLGARTYHALSDRNFYDVVLGLLFVSGAVLVWSSFG